VGDEIELLRRFIDEIPGPSTDAWARARAAIAVARSEEEAAGSRRNRRPGRRWFSIAAAGTVAAAVTGLVAALLSGSPTTRPSDQVQTAAFVRRVERALASPNQDNMVQYARRLLLPGSRIQLGVGQMAIGPGGRSGLGVGVTVSWSYHGTSTTYGFTPSGRPVFAAETSTAASGEITQEVAVIYGDATWWRATLPQPGGRSPSTAPVCGSGAPTGLESSSAFVRGELRCGGYRMARQHPAGGVETVKLTGSNGTTVWVNPSTYLPVRLTVGRPTPTQIDFRWLAPTAANLGQLSVRVPAGFREVPPPRS
jgi:hypothetical protein